MGCLDDSHLDNKIHYILMYKTKFNIAYIYLSIGITFNPVKIDDTAILFFT